MEGFIELIQGKLLPMPNKPSAVVIKPNTHTARIPYRLPYIYTGTCQDSDRQAEPGLFGGASEFLKPTQDYHRPQRDKNGQIITNNQRHPRLKKWVWGYAIGSDRRASAFNVRVQHLKMVSIR